MSDWRVGINMIKVMKKEDVKTRFNLYHRLIEKYYEQKVIWKFNKKLKVVVKENGSKIFIPNFTYHEYRTGLTKTAVKSGVDKGLAKINEIYPIKKELLRGVCYRDCIDITDNQEQSNEQQA